MKSKGGGPHNFKGGSVRKTRKDASVAANRERAEAWASLSAQEQLAVLDRRLGRGVGAGRQRARLARRLEAQS